MTISLDANTGISCSNASGTANLSPTLIVVGNSSVNATGHYYNNSSLAMCDAMAAHNIVVNGEMRISQQNGNTQSNAAPYYPTDQWQLQKGGTSINAVANSYQSTDAPSGYNNSVLLSVTTTEPSVGSDNFLLIGQSFEGYRTSRLGWGAAGAVNATLGMWVKCSVAGSYGICLKNPASNQSWIGLITIGTPNTWTWLTWSIPARATGTWPTDNSAGFTIFINLMIGSAYQGSLGWQTGSFNTTSSQTNLFATAAATFQYTGVVLLSGDYTIASGQSQFIQRHWDDELRICQRYWQKSYDYAITPGSVTSSGSTFHYCQIFTSSASLASGSQILLKCSMRATPAITSYSVSTGASNKMRDTQNSVDVTPTIGNIGENCFLISGVVGAASTTINLQAQWTANARM